MGSALSHVQHYITTHTVSSSKPIYNQRLQFQYLLYDIASLIATRDAETDNRPTNQYFRLNEMSFVVSPLR